MAEDWAWDLKDYMVGISPIFRGRYIAFKLLDCFK